MRSSAPKSSTAATESERQAKDACKEFEALFINMMLKELRATINKSGLMDGGKAEELYTSLMDTQMSREMAAQGGIGLAEMLYRQMMEASGSTNPGPDTQSPPDDTTKWQSDTLKK
jgi:flagellar protein FlgJ